MLNGALNYAFQSCIRHTNASTTGCYPIPNTLHVTIIINHANSISYGCCSFRTLPSRILTCTVLKGHWLRLF